MQHELTLHETRVLGALIEKQVTTPDQYPLSLNALTNACNQKSNRNPVLDLDEQTVQAALDSLRAKYLAAEQSAYGSRVPRFVHRFGNTEFGPLQLTAQELGIMCALLLRGPQTPGELRSHTARLCRFEDVGEVEKVLQDLAGRSDDPLVARLAREPGRRESRFAHLLSGEVENAASLPGSVPHSSGAASPLVEELADEVARLRAEVAAMREELAELKSG